MASSVTSIVLAGGRSSRLGAMNKALERVGTQSLIERVLSRVAQVSQEIIVVVSQQQTSNGYLQEYKVKIMADIFPNKGALGGVYSGLVASTNFHSLAVACDMPFLNTNLLNYMISLVQGFDVVIPHIGENTEPLHAIYSKNCVSPMAELLRQNKMRLADIVGLVKVRYVTETEIDRFDPERLSFFNINTPANLQRARELAEQERHI